MSTRTLRFYFKIVYTAHTWNLDINSDMCTADFVNWINSDDCHMLFNIHHQYHIQVVEAGNNCNGDSELAPPIMVSLRDTIAERFNPRVTSFYLRPVHPITEEFIIKDDYSIAPNYVRTEMAINIPTPEIETEHFNQIVSDEPPQMV